MAQVSQSHYLDFPKRSLNAVKYVSRLFWLLVCVVFNGVTLYQIADLFLKYGREPIKTTNEKSYKDELEFPKVIICNTMPFR